MKSTIQKMYEIVKEAENHPLEDYLTEVIGPVLWTRGGFPLVSYYQNF